LYISMLKFAHVPLDHFAVEILAVGAIETGPEILLDAHQHLGAHASIIPPATIHRSLWSRLISRLSRDQRKRFNPGVLNNRHNLRIASDFFRPGPVFSIGARR
jgi:hypothetical protein